MKKFFTDNYSSYFLVRYLPCNLILFILFMSRKNIVPYYDYDELCGMIFFYGIVPYSMLCYFIGGCFRNWKWMQIFLAERLSALLLVRLSILGYFFLILFYPDFHGTFEFPFPTPDQHVHIPTYYLYLPYVGCFLAGVGISKLKEKLSTIRS